MRIGNGEAWIGFADDEFQVPTWGTGEGVGDVDHSWAWGFDGDVPNRSSTEISSRYGHAWKDGDVIGCMADLDAQTVEFFLNGKSMGVAFKNICFVGQVRPVLSASLSDESYGSSSSYKLRVNLGDDMKFPMI